jgi:opacity protein-like surface antigen
MKKYLFITIFVVSCINVFSQSNTRFTVFVDPKFSWMASDIKGVESDGTKLGVNIGLNMDNFFAQNYAFMTGVSIDNTGGSLKYEINDKPLKTSSNADTVFAGNVLNYKLQYINIPIGLKLKTNEIGYLTFYTHLGINSGINIKAIGEVDAYELENENIADEIKLFNLGYFIGAGVEYSIGGNSAVVLGLTYTNGFIDITTDSDNKVTMSNLTVRIGILF